MTAVLSLGSNVGDRAEHLRAGVELLRLRLDISAVSPIYETDPVGVDGQGAYLNLVALARCDDADNVLSAAHWVEDVRGRLRPARWAPRTLDVDVVDVGGTRRDDPRLTLPHPRAHERAFVLAPWLDLDPDAVVAGRGPVWWLLRRLGRDGVRRWP